MSDVGLGGNEGHWDPVADLPAAQLRLEDEHEFVGRPKAGGALRGADNDRTRVLAECLEIDRGLLGVVDVADRIGKAVGTETLDLVEREFRPGRDDEVVVVQRRTIRRLDHAVLRRNLGHRVRLEGDAALGERRRKVDLDRLALAPAHWNPGIRGHEMIERVLRDDGEPVFGAHLRLHLIGHDSAAEARAHDHDVSHLFLSRGAAPSRGRFSLLVLLYYDIRMRQCRNPDLRRIAPPTSVGRRSAAGPRRSLRGPASRIQYFALTGPSESK